MILDHDAGFHTREDGDGNSRRSAVLHKLEEDVNVIEQLGDNQLATRINLRVRMKRMCVRKGQR